MSESLIRTTYIFDDGWEFGVLSPSDSHGWLIYAKNPSGRLYELGELYAEEEVDRYMRALAAIWNQGKAFGIYSERGGQAV